jgi:DNA segregation ATPase FtsK/SpoIIIE, S-DNA-T family
MLRRSLTPPSSPSWRPRWYRRTAFAAAVLAWLCRRAFGLCRWLARHATGVATVVLVAALYAVMDAVDTRPRQAAVGLLLLACLAWVVWQPALAEGRRPMLSAWRHVWVYRRSWNPAMTLAGLAHGRSLPELRRVRVDGVFDVVHCVMLPGQLPDDWYARRERLAQVFGCESCTVFAVGGRSRLIVLEFVARGSRAFPSGGESW